MFMRTQALPLQACKSDDCFSERYPQPGSSLLTTVATTPVMAITRFSHQENERNRAHCDFPEPMDISIAIQQLSRQNCRLLKRCHFPGEKTSTLSLLTIKIAASTGSIDNS